MANRFKKLDVAILGSGNIGTDLLIKVLRSPYLNCRLFIGRRLGSPGMAKAMSLGVRVSDQGVNAILREPNICDLVFDATSAEDHKRHWPALDALDKIAVDLTPAKVGQMCVPAVNLDACMGCRNVNMVSCGGQVSIPLVYLLGNSTVRWRMSRSCRPSRHAARGPRRVSIWMNTCRRRKRACWRSRVRNAQRPS